MLVSTWQRRRSFLVMLALAACASSRGPGEGDGNIDGGPTCAPGEQRCDGNTVVVCNDRGEPVPGEVCASACAPDRGCVVCVPGTGMCRDGEAVACRPDGSGYSSEPCDPVQGMTCEAETGRCTGACSARGLGASYIGCEYYPTVTGNKVSNDYHFAVAIANTTTVTATVTIEDGGLTAPIVVAVPPASVTVQALPWQLDLKLQNGNRQSDNDSPAHAALVERGAYHLRSTTPVTVYQFNPLEYQLDDAADGTSFTNDASLLLPTNVWRDRYVVASWPHVNGVNPSQLAVTAMEDGTRVTIDAKAASLAGGGAPAFAVGTPQTVTLNAGGVLELASRTGDFTGSFVTADRPVQVIGAHFCAKVPLDVPACDHLEESMFSVEALGERYVVHAPALPSMPSGKVNVVRIIATAPNTAITYTPPQAGAPTAIAAAGDFVEIEGTRASFLIEASAKVLVAQYMEGQNAGGGAGDPSMALAVPVDQFRVDYLFHAPVNYETNFVDVTAPTGATVMLDGAALTFAPVGSSGYGLARVTLTAGPGGDGNHTMTGDMPFGISVYGYGTYTSYWYPGGLDLRPIPVD
jgi:hypothetical protein